MAAGDACESCDESAERFARSCQNGISVHKECAAGDLAGITADHGGDGCRNRDKRAFPIFYCHADTDTGTCQGCGSFSKQIDHISGRTADQKTDLLNHCTDNQGCKKTLRHAAEAINEATFLIVRIWIPPHVCGVLLYSQVTCQSTFSLS